jgi:hypothetical protein
VRRHVGGYVRRHVGGNVRRHLTRVTNASALTPNAPCPKSSPATQEGFTASTSVSVHGYLGRRRDVAM